MNLDDIFDTLWGDYTTQNPEVQNVYELFINEGETVINDHIAFRTFDRVARNSSLMRHLFTTIWTNTKPFDHGT